MTIKRPEKILSELILRALTTKRWSVDNAAGQAKKMKLPSLSARNIREYLSEKRQTPAKATIERFADLFDESRESWLSQFPGYGVGPMLLGRESILQNQLRLQDGDLVTLISSRPFLEAEDQLVQNTVLQNLNRGLKYIYYYPDPTAKPNPFGVTASASYLMFRDIVRRYRFATIPLLFGFPLRHSEFKFFSGLHTVVRLQSSNAHFTKTYAFIEIESGDQIEQAWYELPKTVWQQINANLVQARSGIADMNQPITALNPCLTSLRAEYMAWFKLPTMTTLYSKLRPTLGHAGDRCMKEIVSEISKTEFPDETVNYLDIGCGDGEITSAITSHLVKRAKVYVVCLDVSSAQIMLASKAVKTSDRVSVETTTVEFESYKTDMQFHLITAIHSLYVVDQAYIRSIYDRLAPGGIAFIWMASRHNNIMTHICNDIDSVLRSGQRRNSAEDMHEYAQLAGLSTQFRTVSGTIEALLDSQDNLTDDAETLLEFCALQTLPTHAVARNTTVNTIRRLSTESGGVLSLTDGLLLIVRHL